MEISKLKVLQSNAGFYIGKTCKIDGFDHPYCRQSEYFSTVEKAEEKLQIILSKDN